MSDEGYAPKSPDLSSFYSEGPTPPAPQLSQSNKNHHLADYKSATSSLAYTTNYAPPSAATSAPSYVPPQQGNRQPQPHHNHSHNHNLYSLSHQPQSAPIHSDEGQHPAGTYPPPAQIHQLPLHYDQKFPSSHDYDYGLQQNPFQQPSYGQPYANHQSQPQPQPQLQTQPQTYHAVPSYPEPYAPPSLGATSLSPRFDQHQLPQQTHPATKMPPRKAPPPPPPVIEPSPVRTKFPTARIKRIMQADEEVGKVAQQTPIAVGKALELFMIQLVSKSADIARDKGSKRVSAQMLKQVVETDEQWDFLRDIVSRVEAEKEGSKGTKHKQESSSDEEMSEPKKRTRGPGRKKKTA